MPAQFILSLAGGIVILIGGIISLLWAVVAFEPSFDPLSELRTVMGEEEFRAFQLRYTIAGLSSGATVILVSFLLRSRPRESKRWGVMIIVLSAMSILGMGGFIFGMALGITGGALAIIRGRTLEVQEPPKQDKVDSVQEVQAEVMAYKCSSCDILFKSDEELKQHVIRTHMRH